MSTSSHLLPVVQIPPSGDFGRWLTSINPFISHEADPDNQKTGETGNVIDPYPFNLGDFL